MHSAGNFKHLPADDVKECEQLYIKSGLALFTMYAAGSSRLRAYKAIRNFNFESRSKKNVREEVKREPDDLRELLRDNFWPLSILRWGH